MAHVYHVWFIENAQNVIQKDFAIKQCLMSMTSLNTEGGTLPNKWSWLVKILIINGWSHTIEIYTQNMMLISTPSAYLFVAWWNTYKSMYIRVMIVLLLSLKAVHHIMTVRKLNNIEKGMKSRNIWIVTTYLQLSYVGGFLTSAYSINILLYKNFNTTCLENN